ncbi:MAG: hypothetical protein JNK66_08625, partial [Chitinophagales bacterium]|nr:hypothetical protein [Chitinophagales bacterium]
MKAKFYTLVAALAMLCHFQKATAQTVQITCSVFGNTVRACDTAVYVFSVTNFNKAFTITNIFSGAVT